MAFDLLPRVVFHTSLGAVVVTIDPSTPLGGVVQIPGVGSVPYDVDVTGPSMIVHLPVYGDVVIPLLPTGSSTPLSIPGLGAVTYEVVFGPVDLPPEQLANMGVLGSFFDPMFFLVGGVVVVAYLLTKAKRNPRYRRNAEVSAHCAGGRHAACSGVIARYVGPRLVKTPCVCKCHEGSRFIGQLWPPQKKPKRNPCGCL